MTKETVAKMLQCDLMPSSRFGGSLKRLAVLVPPKGGNGAKEWEGIKDNALVDCVVFDNNKSKKVSLIAVVHNTVSQKTFIRGHIRFLNYIKWALS